MATTTDPTVTVYDIETNTQLYRLSTTDAQNDLVLHHRRGATIHEYDTTDRNGVPLHIAITVDAPRHGCTPDQGAVYEAPGTTAAPEPAASSPSAASDATDGPADDAPYTPNGQYQAALDLYRAKGAAHAPDDALMAGFCENSLQTIVGAVSPQLVWEGAQKRGLTAKELLHLCSTDIFAVDDLQWI